MSVSDQPLLKSPGLSLVSSANMFERGGPSSPGSLSRLTFMGRETGTDKTIAALGVLSILSLLQSILAVILIVRFDMKQDEFHNNNSSKNGVELDEGLYNSMLDSGMVLASFCVMLNFCCLVVCTIQCYFAAKMMKLPQGEERAYKFLSNTSGARFLVISAFFAAIPVFLSALCLYLLIEFRFIPAIISTSFIALGVFFTIFCFSRSVHLWRKEQKRVAKGLNAYEPSTPSQHDHHSVPITMVNGGYINGGMSNGGLPNGGLSNGGLSNSGLAKLRSTNNNHTNAQISNGGSVNGGSVNSALHNNNNEQDDSIDGFDDKTEKTPIFYAINHVGSGDTLNTSNLSTLV